MVFGLFGGRSTTSKDEGAKAGGGEELLDGDGADKLEDGDDGDKGADEHEGEGEHNGEEGDNGEGESAAKDAIEDAADGEVATEEATLKKKKKNKKDTKKKNKKGPQKDATYNCQIFDVTFTNALEKPISPFFHFTVGHKVQKIDHRAEGGGIEERATPGPKFETDTLLRISPEDMAQCQRTKHMQWFGTYADLSTENLRIKTIHRPPCCTYCGCNEWRGCKRIKIATNYRSLKALANGCVSQEFDIVEDRGRTGMVGIGTLRFNIFFEELFDFELEFLEWQARDLYAADEGGTSDPYVVLSIKSDWFKMFAKGGLMGRRVTSHVEYNTLFPKWPEMPSPLEYNGTWSELQNEILMIHVYDKDMFGSDTLIGWTRIPLNGQFRDNGDTAEGQVRSGLAFTKAQQQEVAPGKLERVKVIEAAGEIIGSIRIESMPKYKQFGAPAILKSGMQYLCVQIYQAHNLPSTDENGLTDAFFVVEWCGMVQKTKVVFKTLDPIFKEKLYFPVLLFKFSAEEMAKKDQTVHITCYDFDDDGTCDFQGFAEFELWEITAAKPQTLDGVTARIAVKNSIHLQKSRSPNATVDIRVWFEPSPLEDEDGEEIILEKVKVKQKATLPENYTDRAIVWMEGIKRAAPRAWRKSRLLGGYLYKSFDERSIEHFLPCYLNPLSGPLDLQNPKEVFRMIACVPFETDLEISRDADAWASPKFFLDIKKGDSKDHALLCANLFLGLSIDTYVCVGKACVKIIDPETDEESSGPGEDTHVWVMTRQGNGSVILWEACTGKHYLLPRRWTGSEENHEEEEEEEEAAEGVEGQEEEDVDEEKAFSAFYEDDVTLNQERLAAKDFWKSEMIDHANQAGIGADSNESSDEDEDLRLTPLTIIPPYYSIQVVFNHENIWANLQSLDPTNCLYEIDNEMQWKPFCSFDEGFSPESSDLLPFYKPPTIPARLKKERANKLQQEILASVKEQVNYIRDGKMLEVKIYEPDDDSAPNKHMEHVLGKGLKLMEDRLLANDDNKRDTIMSRLSSWKGELIKSSPPNVAFEGIPINFAYSDGKRISQRICEKYEEFLIDSELDVQFVFGVYVAPYYCSVNSAWVYIGKMRPLPDEEDRA